MVLVVLMLVVEEVNQNFNLLLLKDKVDQAVVVMVVKVVRMELAEVLILVVEVVVPTHNQTVVFKVELVVKVLLSYVTNFRINFNN
jgi:hypothetical protein